MANRVVYSCNSSDMDVSDSDDGAQMCQQEDSTFSSLTRSFSRMETDGYDSESSFHTALMSPRTSSEELEPGQISDSIQSASMPPLDPLEIECRALETQLQFYQGKISNCDQELKKLTDAQERIKIQLLKYEVRNSIARNRKPKNRAYKADLLLTPPTNAVSSENTLLTLSTDTVDNNKRPSTRLSDSYPSTTNKRNATAPSKGTPATQIILDVAIPSPGYVPPLRPTTPKETVMEEVLPNPLQSMEQLSQSSMPNNRKRILSDSESGFSPPSKAKRSHRRAKKESLLQKKKAARPIRLEDAIIDKPLSARYVQKIKREDDSSSSDEETAIFERENKKERKMRERDAMITDEERALVTPDAPPYPGRREGYSREASKKARTDVLNLLRLNPPSLKSMRISLINLKETSIIQGKHLTLEQEEFARGLIRKILRLIEDYMILPEDVYCRPSRLQPPNSPKTGPLPERYYGNLGTKSYDGPDVSHHELYKAIHYFASITNAAALRKADQFLLTSGRPPQQRVHRTCDPANPDKTSTIPLDMHMKDNPDVLALIHQNTQSKEESKPLKGRGRDRKQQNRKRLQEQAELKKLQMTTPIDDVKNIPSASHSDSSASAQAQPTLNEININRLYEYYSKKETPSQAHGDSTLNEIINIDDDEPKSLPSPKEVSSPIIVEVAHKELSNSQNSPTLPEIPTVAQSNENPSSGTNTQSSSLHFQPYKSALSSLGLANTPKLTNQPKLSTLCSAESSGGVCNVTGCRYTHFSDYT